MNTFIYPNGHPIQITEESRLLNHYTWENYQSRVYETDSIRYVYNKLEEITKFHGRAHFADIGAQSGLYSLYAKYFDHVFVDSFEPFPSSFNCLRDNIVLNNIQGRVIPHQVAVSNKKGKTVLRCPPNHNGLNTLGETPMRFNNWNEVEIQTDTLDNLYADRRLDFIKADTEGWEYFIIQGGMNVLRRDRPELLIEVCQPNMQQCNVTFEQLSTLLSELGYRNVGVFDLENFAFSTRLE